MSARPVCARGSSTDPALTYVLNETTGASWRSMTMKWRPLASVNSLTFFSNSLRSCAGAKKGARRVTKQKANVEFMLWILYIVTLAQAQMFRLAEFVVIGCEIACGDPVFASQASPHSVFTAMHGGGLWEPTLVAPSLPIFRDCLEAVRRFANGRGCLAELEANPPSEQEQARFIKDIRQFTAADAEASAFWPLD